MHTMKYGVQTLGACRRIRSGFERLVLRLVGVRLHRRYTAISPASPSLQVTKPLALGPTTGFSGRLLVVILALICAPVWAQSPTIPAGATAEQESSLVITEIHSNPDVKTELVEFIELHNTSDVDVDLSGCYLTDAVDYTFSEGTLLQAGAYLIVGQDPGQIIAKWSGGGGRGGSLNGKVLGPYIGGLRGLGERIRPYSPGGTLLDEVSYRLGFPWPVVGDAVPENSRGNGHSLQLLNPLVDNDLGGSWRSALPTPAQRPAGGFWANLPPHIRQVKHRPRNPRSNEPVVITAKITDADGVGSVGLFMKAVGPGDYNHKESREYGNGWITLPMQDNGENGDVQANDHIYSVQIPAEVQQHRWLVRYTILVTDSQSAFLQVPYVDDPQPNFAYFVYDGVPAWQGADRPGVTPVVEYGPEVMNSVPVYHVLSKKADVDAAIWNEQYSGSAYKWYCTLVYDGEVYDHIRFRTRGGVWRYAMKKNMWKFDFNRGHSFRARDDYGKRYDIPWDKMNFSACIQQGDYQHRGEQGMFEAVGFKLFNMMGVEAPKTNYLQLRVIDEAAESGANQYRGDFWGLYLTLEQMDGRFLDEHGLPDGNLYKMEGGNGDLNNQGATAVTNRSDLSTFQSRYRSGPSVQWWKDNVDLRSYYGYRCVLEGIHHGDVGYGKNYFFYLNPETNIWSQLPWDLDLTWANNMYGNGEDPFKGRGRIFSHAALRLEYDNRLREFHDLLYSGDQMGQLIDEFAAIIDDPEGGLSIVDADRAMWDYNPLLASGGKAGQGRFYQRASTKDFPGMVQIMKDYVTRGPREFDSYREDPDVPDTPTVRYTGQSDFARNDLVFETSAFGDPQGSHTFAALKWRIAEVAPGSAITEPVDPGIQGTILVPAQSTWRYFKGTEEPSPTGTDWRASSFDDSLWPTGPAPIGYGEGFVRTLLNDMRGGYSTVYLRKTFDVTDLDEIGQLSVDLKYDDGIIVWINEQPVVMDNVFDELMPYNVTALSTRENLEFVSFQVADASSVLQEGANVMAIQLFNVSRYSSSDCFVDVRLIGEQDGPNTPDDDEPMASVRQNGKYEIDALWESSEMTTFVDQIRIPATVVEPGATYRVRCRMLDSSNRWSHWSAPVQFAAGGPVAEGIVANLRITELMANPAPAAPGQTIDSGAFEFVELKNTGDESLDISSVSFTQGIVFDFTDSPITALSPGAHVLVVKDEQAFTERYGVEAATRIAGQYLGQLANNGERIAVEDFWNGMVLDFSYGDGRAWPLGADGAGHSLVPRDSALIQSSVSALNYPGHWRRSTHIHGSPGADDPAPVETVVINEFVANPPAGQTDWVQIHNRSEGPVSLRNWYLSDDIDDLAKWAIPSQISLAPHASQTFYLTGTSSAISANFSLRRNGEALILSYLPDNEPGGIRDGLDFKAQQRGFSTGRYPDGQEGWFIMTPSRDSANVPPLDHMVMSEVMYHPPEPALEYIELTNPTDQPVVLGSGQTLWRVNGAVDFLLPLDLVLQAGERMVLVGFDPTLDTDTLNTFIAAYGIDSATVQLVGPWSGNLANNGERLALEQAVTASSPDNTNWILWDEFVYSDEHPWPVGPDGQGDALQRIDLAGEFSGMVPANWMAGPPTPGTE